MPEKLVYVDTDLSLGTPGAEIDDGAALIFLFRNREIEVVGTGSVFGNVPLQDATANLDRLLTWLEAAHVPFAAGAAKPLLSNLAWFEIWQAGYEATLPWTPRPVSLVAANLIIETVHKNPHRVSLLSLGPMTNLALAIRLAPDIVPVTRQVIVMGGSFNRENPIPEFNARCDPEAAQIVFNAGWDLHILGLDITRRIHYSRRDFASLPHGNPAVELLRAQAPGWIDRVEGMGWEQDGCALHDAVAAAYLVDDSIFQTEETCVEVELADPDLRGATRFSYAQKDKPVVKVITGVKAGKCRELIWSYLTR